MKKIHKVFFLVFTSLVFLSPIKTHGQEKKFTQTGYASFYADKFEGRLTASGEKYYHAKSTAAHKTLEFGTIVKVTNLSNNKTTAVRINDRGPHVEGRIIDLSKSAAKKLGFINKGITKVKIEVIDNPFDTPEEKEKSEAFYKINIKKTDASGFGIQLASYRKLSNLLNKIDQLPGPVKKDFHIQVAEKGTREIYRLIYGFYDDRGAAERQKTKLKNYFPECFITEY
jgi:rare lipoprotein A